MTKRTQIVEYVKSLPTTGRLLLIVALAGIGALIGYGIGQLLGNHIL
ncbi:hypothetical protein FLK61_33700 [Paenalkalicoccus suaedae]|uniref:Uncharacterized protein n=1 Tax=Paenalkalicoccus suaedae TaxID=2592382 RepID=A0A859FG36_9BACI|nr:hypothetical protein [Paenalkalicoccus suaedae]QKS71642.1 hypothetical protein FLK61_33700 [Paenalkalicoccus suaedae]